MRHIDLFSGIGGFSLAAHWLGWETVAFVEKDEFCQKVLRKNFGKDIDIHDDITTFSGESFRGQCDIITGGFPCQPFSSLGHRRGKEDDRYLWDETIRVVKESGAAWFVGENVTGIINLALDNVLSDLESAGYAAQAFVIPACGIGAEHQRNRVWIIGNSESRRFLSKQIFDRASYEIYISKRSSMFSQNSLFELQNRSIAGNHGESDGLPGRLDKPKRNDSRFVPKTDNEFRLKSLGNSIVPQIAYEIFKAIEATEKESI